MFSKFLFISELIVFFSICFETFQDIFNILRFVLNFVVSPNKIPLYAEYFRTNDFFAIRSEFLNIPDPISFVFLKNSE